MNVPEKMLMQNLITAGDRLSRVLANVLEALPQALPAAAAAAADASRFLSEWSAVRKAAAAASITTFHCTFYADVMKFDGLVSSRTLCSIYVDAVSKEEVLHHVVEEFPKAGCIIVKEAPAQTGQTIVDDTATSKEDGDEHR